MLYGGWGCRLPTVMKFGNIRFYIYGDDHNPPHVHVVFRDRMAVIAIGTGLVMKHKGFKESELKVLVQKIAENKDTLVAAWRSFNEDE